MKKSKHTEEQIASALKQTGGRHADGGDVPQDGHFGRDFLQLA